MDWYLHRRLGARKQALFADLPRDVVELGSGAGASMRYLAPGSRLVAIEPNPHTHDALRRSADAVRDRPRDRSETCRVDRPRERERRRGDLHARAVHGGRTTPLRSRRCAASCVLEDGSCSSSTSGPVPVRSEQCSGCSVARGDTSSTVAASTATPRRRSQRPASPTCGSSTYRFGGVFVPVWPQISGVAVA